MGRLPYLPKEALSEFLNRYEQAELNAYDDLSTVRQAQKAQNASLYIMERRAKRLGSNDEQIRKFMLGFMEQAFID